MTAIRTLFSTRRPIDRPIEKVIDYYATDEKRLLAEIEEYEVTDNVEACVQRLLDVYGEGTRRGDVTQVGVWVAGFYGSGKSSFTKYLGLALDGRSVGGRPFLDLLAERLQSAEARASLLTVARQSPTAVVLLDLGAEMLAESALEPVSTVLYWKVLQWAGYSKEKKLAQLELTLDLRGLMDRFREVYRTKFKADWESVHNDPLVGVARASQIAPEVLPKEFPTPDAFRSLRFEEALDLRDRAGQIVELVQRKTGKPNVLFLVDEAGQYVAPRQELILNLDGLARNFKELGKGKVWIVCTGQQTLTEIVEKAALNSAELNKLRDRFPIAINLEARDIREITYRRLLTKAPDGEKILRAEFARAGQALVTHTRLTGTALFKGDPDAETFARLYPFLPQHFDLLLELIRTLARSTGGIGLRSAIRVIQDLLVDASRALPAGTTRLADRSIGCLAGADDFFDTLRADIAKVLPHVVHGVERVASAFPDDPLVRRAAKAIAALQAIEGFPRTAENIAALLHTGLGASSLLPEVREALERLKAARECSLVEDPQAGGFLFLSEGVKPLRDRRNAFVPTTADVSHVRSQLLKAVFEVPPAARLEGVKEVKAGVRWGRTPVVGEDSEVHFRIEAVEPVRFAARRKELLAETNTLSELKNAVVWLVSTPPELEDHIVETCRSEKIAGQVPEREADRDVAQFLRSERRAADGARRKAREALEAALFAGTFVFRGGAVGVAEAGATLDSACRAILGKAAEAVLPQFRLVAIRPGTDLAARFLGVERLDRMPREHDPLGLVKRQGGSARVDTANPALAEALRVLGLRAEAAGTGRVQGNVLQDLFSQAPYGWSKDATRYLFAALLRAGEVEIHGADGVIRTPGPQASEAFKSTQAFGRVGVSRRDVRPSPEMLDRAARRLLEISGEDVLPLEDRLAQAVRKHLPGLLEEIGSLPDRLRLLEAPGTDRARQLIERATDLLKQDGGEAAALLGEIESTLPADFAWARGVSAALAGGGEETLRAASALRRDVADLALLHPAEAADLVTAEDEAALAETLASDALHERLPALRGTLRRIGDGLATRHGDLHREYLADLDRARAEIESLPDWGRLGDDDRAEVAARLSRAGLPARPAEGQEAAALRLLLARRAQLPGLATLLADEVRRRAPAPPPPSPPPSPAPSALAEPPVPSFAEPEEVRLGEVRPEAVLATEKDVEDWIAEARTRLLATIRAGRRARVR